MKYQLTGKIYLREEYGPGEIEKDHTEIVDASSKEEAIELSLSSFMEWEEPVWDEGYPLVSLVPNS